MQVHVLWVGEALVIDGRIRLTVLKVEGDLAVLGVTPPGLIGDEAPLEALGERGPRRMARPMPMLTEN
jgi:hypothetical protein